MTEREVAAVRDVFASAWLGEGQWTTRFEERVAGYVGAHHAVAVNTGTSALHLALSALGVGPGDEVIVPALTFVSDPLAVRMCGATPVFADIDAASLNLDPADVAARVTPRTRVVMPTDYAGLPMNVSALRQSLGSSRIRIVRDAAHSFGSSIEGRPVGAWCGEDLTCFSFDPIKNLTCGEGGAVVVNDKALAVVLREKRTLGFLASARSRSAGSAAMIRGVVSDGFRYHMSNINAAIGLAQFERLPELLEGRRAVARLYDQLLAGSPEVKTFERDYSEVVPFIYPVLVDAGVRDGLIAQFAELGIHADLRYSPCHQEPLFFDQRVSLPVTERIAECLLCLPIYAGLEPVAVREIVDVLHAGAVTMQRAQRFAPDEPAHGIVAGIDVPEYSSTRSSVMRTPSLTKKR